jgi:uncharacterized protein (TIGR02147 family)
MNNSYKEILKNELAKRTARNPRYSLRSFARTLGFEPTVISQILSGKRIPSPKTAKRLIKGLGIGPDEAQNFLSSLAETQQSRNLLRSSPYFRHFELSKEPRQELALDQFKVISDWYHYAILALAQTQQFQSSPKWIASQINISELEAKLAIERLKNLGLLKEEDKKLKSSEEGFITADQAITNSALRKHQAQILEKALDSLQNDPIEERNMTSMTVAIDPKRIPEAKKLIQSFTQDLVRLLETGERTRVYEIGFALFPLQKKEK